jgi:hypothetical protein
MYLRICLLLFINLLASTASAQPSERARSADNVARVALGLVSLELRPVGRDVLPSKVGAGIVVRITGESNSVQSWGISNEAGIVIMPLPPGDYCYALYTRAGIPLQLERRGFSPCLTVVETQVTQVGLEYRTLGP